MCFWIMLGTPVTPRAATRTLRPKLGNVRGQASNSRPAQPGSLVTRAASVRAFRGGCLVAVGSAARGRQRPPAYVPCGRGTCLGTATCVPDQAPGEPPDGTQGCRSTSVCQRPSGVVHGTP